MRGGSIVDLTFGCPAVARRVRGWRVVEEAETLSDHRYIRFDISAQTSSASVSTAPRENSPRWALTKLDREALLEASIVQAWVFAPVRPVDVDEEAMRLREAMSHVCDAAMPRVQPRPWKSQVHWWSQEIALLRISCVRARRQYTRHRRRNRHTEDATAREAELYEEYRARKKALQVAIKEAKSQAYKEMLETLQQDPWGRPYLMVRNKLRSRAPPLTQSLRPQLLGDVVGALFPARAEHQPPPMAPPTTNADENNDDVPEVTRAELRTAVLRMKAKKTAPGPDGIPGRAWVLASEALEPRLIGLLSACFERGQFPRVWKTGKLVLIKKTGRPADSPSAFRPIVLLDEVAKMFEKIIADRLVAHLSSVGPDLADNQFGFRRGRSTIDAIMRVRALTKEAISQGEVVLAVSLDIANAFNTLPWSCIRAALEYHRVPLYLRRIVGAYLFERAVIFPGRESTIRREMSCGVPQGSVLGPLLWNIGYDWVLRGAFLAGVDVFCYADDTLVTARAGTHREATILGTAGVAQVVARIRRLGLEVALHKSEALFFHGPRNRPPQGSSIVVGGVRIGVESTMKYLGLVLDGRWDFGAHLRTLAPKLRGAAAALSRLLPNLRGPEVSCRRLYAGVVRSMALYGAPCWADALTVRKRALLRQSQRAMAVRVIRGYRTISFEAASLLAGSPPWDLEAKLLASLYTWREEAVARDLRPLPQEIEGQRQQLRRILEAEWSERLAQPSAGHAAIAAVRPIMAEWLGRKHGALSYRLTQVVTGHGCFGAYLCRIGREPTRECHHCGNCPEDTALHTLAECPAWGDQRRALVVATGLGSLSLPALVQSMVGSRGAWDAAASFCEEVMSRKEAAERERERIANQSLPPLRGGTRRGGRHRNRDDLRPP